MRRYCSRWLFLYASAVAAVLVPLAAFNFVIDPMTLYRRDGLYLVDRNFSRIVGAGMVRTTEKPGALVVGNSYLANADSEQIQRIFGYKTEVVSQWGLEQGEINRVLDYALQRIPSAKLVFLTTAIWDTCQVGPHPTSPLPRPLYGGHVWAEFSYLLSGETARLSRQKLVAPQTFATDPRMVPRWWDDHATSIGNVDALRRELSAHPTPKTRTPPHPAQRDEYAGRLLACFEGFAKRVTQAYPQISFVFINPPHLQWLLHQRHQFGILDGQIAAMEKIAEFVDTLPNARYFDFYAAHEWTSNCSYWRDVGHFDLEVTNGIFEAISRGDFERTKATNADLTRKTIESVTTMADCE